MGAWGCGSFDNDDAMDFAGDFLDAKAGIGTEKKMGKIGLIIGCLSHVTIDEEDDADKKECDATDASCALAMAEIVAASLGKPCKELSAASDDEDDTLGQIAAWVKSTGCHDEVMRKPGLRKLAIDAVTRVRDNSELAELWREAKKKDATQWRKGVDDLLARLK